MLPLPQPPSSDPLPRSPHLVGLPEHGVRDTGAQRAGLWPHRVLLCAVMSPALQVWFCLAGEFSHLLTGCNHVLPDRLDGAHPCVRGGGRGGRDGGQAMAGLCDSLDGMKVPRWVLGLQVNSWCGGRSLSSTLGSGLGDQAGGRGGRGGE